VSGRIELQKFLHASPDFIFGALANLEAERDVAVDRHVFERSVVLE
jgi:hypothetical protein